MEAGRPDAVCVLAFDSETVRTLALLYSLESDRVRACWFDDLEEATAVMPHFIEQARFEDGVEMVATVMLS